MRGLLGGRSASLVASFAVLAVAPSQTTAHDVYIASDNHTDYGWNATTDAYDDAMVAEISYYLDQIDATAGDPAHEQARYNPDCWWYLYLYQQRRPDDFARLISAIQTGHITVPLNPFVTLYGALPTEAAIRAGYYPGKIQRNHGVEFPLAQDIENATNPWGIASIWAGSQVRYTWKGICGCGTLAPYQDRTDEVFRWQGPDGKQLIMKWYQFVSGDGWGGYAEARGLSTAGVAEAIAHFSAQAPNLPVTGLFGAGWDDVEYRSTAVVDVVGEFNAANPTDRAIVSNRVDYFEAVEASGVDLPAQRGGWGNDWDIWPSSLAERTAITRRAMERLRTAEALLAFVHLFDATVWPAQQAVLEPAYVDYFKYFEHGWENGGVTIEYVIDNKKSWADSVKTRISQVEDAARQAFADLLQTPDEDRFAVFNPLGFDRTDIADFPVETSEPLVVIDIDTGQEVPSQIIQSDSGPLVRVLARDVPAAGYRVFRYATGTPQPQPDAATVAGPVIENDRYRVTLGDRGDVTSVVDKLTERELVGTGLNDFGSGGSQTLDTSASGPVSVTLQAQVQDVADRRVRITLFREIDRIEIDNEILGNAGRSSYRFNVSLTSPQIRFEEVGAIARPGLVSQGGDFLPGTRADAMTLNHFVSFSESDYSLVLSNWDAFLMRVGDSDITSFDLATPEVSVLAVGDPASAAGIPNQGGDQYFRNRFALRAISGAFSAAEAMRTALAHQNPLVAIPLSRSHSGPIASPTGGLIAVRAPSVVLTALKPTEDADRGLLVRIWELGGSASDAAIDATQLMVEEAHETSLVETDLAAASVDEGVVTAALSGNEIKALRLVPQGFGGGRPPVDPLADAGPGPGTDPAASGGCGCRASAGSPAASVLLVALIALGGRRRRRTRNQTKRAPVIDNLAS